MRIKIKSSSDNDGEIILHAHKNLRNNTPRPASQMVQVESVCVVLFPNGYWWSNILKYQTTRYTSSDLKLRPDDHETRWMLKALRLLDVITEEQYANHEKYVKVVCEKENINWHMRQARRHAKDAGHEIVFKKKKKIGYRSRRGMAHARNDTLA